MTCFWTGTLAALQKIEKVPQSYNIYQLITYLQNHVGETPSITWNGAPISKHEQMDNAKHILVYDAKTAPGGYLTACDDPFLLLIAELFQLNIHFLCTSGPANQSF